MTDLTRRQTNDSVAFLIIVSLLVAPIAMLDANIFGFQLSGWAWLVLLALGLPLVAVLPLDVMAARYLLPFLLFLGYSIATLAWVDDFGEGVATLVQMSVVAVAYILGWQVRDRERLFARLHVVGIVGIGLIALVAIATLGGRTLVGDIGMLVRPAAIGLVVFVVLVGARESSWTVFGLAGAAALAVAIGTGSRASGALLVVVVLTCPAMTRSRPRWLLVTGVSILLLLAATSTEAFRERFFFSDDASIRDILTASEQLDTSGRRELWPKLLDECSANAVGGTGIGSATGLSRRFTGNQLDHPHNEYIRIYCDQGLVGTALLWGFVIWAGVRIYRGVRQEHGRDLHAAAGQLLVSLILLSITDNPLLYTALFMAPLAILLGLSDSAAVARARRRRPGNRATPGQFVRV